MSGTQTIKEGLTSSTGKKIWVVLALIIILTIVLIIIFRKKKTVPPTPPPAKPKPGPGPRPNPTYTVLKSFSNGQVICMQSHLPLAKALVPAQQTSPPASGDVGGFIQLLPNGMEWVNPKSTLDDVGKDTSYQFIVGNVGNTRTFMYNNENFYASIITLQSVSQPTFSLSIAKGTPPNGGIFQAQQTTGTVEVSTYELDFFPNPAKDATFFWSSTNTGYINTDPATTSNPYYGWTTWNWDATINDYDTSYLAESEGWGSGIPFTIYEISL